MGGGLRLRLASVRREAARSLYGYGVWSFLLNTARMFIPQFSPFLVGARLGVAAVTPYNVAARLMTYGTTGLKAGTSVLTPVSASLHAEEKYEQQRQLFLEGGKYCLALALFFVTLFIVLGRPFITLWVGPALAAAAGLLLILAVGEVLPMSQWVTYSIMLGMGRHKVPACVSVVENVVVITLALLLAGPYGLAGVCVAIAVPGMVCRGLIQVVHACHVLGVPLRTYARQALLPPLAAAALPGAGLAVLTLASPPTTWAGLITCGLLYGSGYAVCGVLFLGDDRVRRKALDLLRKPFLTAFWRSPAAGGHELAAVGA
jgi:O-antigen/teichoic acid export membrane protein